MEGSLEDGGKCGSVGVEQELWLWLWVFLENYSRCEGVRVGLVP